MTGSLRRPRTWVVLALVLVVVGVTALVLGITGQQSPPQPAADTGAAAITTRGTDPTDAIPGSASPTTEDRAPVPVAEPVSLAIPAIGVTSDLSRLGLNDDGTVAVPPLEQNDHAGWYERGPAPGAVGPAVILGHVDSAQWGPGVFFDLGALTAGDEIDVTRADGSVAQFVVDRVERHPKDDFPTIEVYGNTDDPQLRLITCGGAFDSSVRSYEDNIVVFATLSGTRPA